MSNEIQQSAIMLTGTAALVATLAAWHPFVDVYVDASADPALLGSVWEVFAVTGGAGGTRTKVATGTVNQAAAKTGGQRVLASVPMQGCDTIELRAYSPIRPSATPIRGAIVGWDPAAATTDPSDTTSAANGGLASGTTETVLGTVPWHPQAAIYVQAGDKAKGMGVFLRAVLPSPFVAKPLVAQGFYGDVEPARLVCSAQGGASSWQMSASAPAGATGPFHMAVSAAGIPGQTAPVPPVVIEGTTSFFTYREGAPTSGSVYATFALACAAANATGVEATVVVDPSLGTPEVTAGNYDLTNITLQAAFSPNDYNNGPSVPLHWRADARIVNGWKASKQLRHIIDDSGALSDHVWGIGTGDVGRTIFEDTYVQSDSGNTNRSLVDVTGAGELDLILRGNSRFLAAFGTQTTFVQTFGTAAVKVTQEDGSIVDATTMEKADGGTSTIDAYVVSPAARCNLAQGNGTTIHLEYSVAWQNGLTFVVAPWATASFVPGSGIFATFADAYDAAVDAASALSDEAGAEYTIAFYDSTGTIGAPNSGDTYELEEFDIKVVAVSTFKAQPVPVTVASGVKFDGLPSFENINLRFTSSTTRAVDTSQIPLPRMWKWTNSSVTTTGAPPEGAVTPILLSAPGNPTHTHQWAFNAGSAFSFVPPHVQSTPTTDSAPSGLLTGTFTSVVEISDMDASCIIALGPNAFIQSDTLKGGDPSNSFRIALLPGAGQATGTVPVSATQTDLVLKPIIFVQDANAVQQVSVFLSKDDLVAAGAVASHTFSIQPALIGGTNVPCKLLRAEIVANTPIAGGAIAAAAATLQQAGEDDGTYLQGCDLATDSTPQAGPGSNPYVSRPNVQFESTIDLDGGNFEDITDGAIEYRLYLSYATQLNAFAS